MNEGTVKDNKNHRQHCARYKLFVYTVVCVVFCDSETQNVLKIST